jgi:hypothetical protein
MRRIFELRRRLHWIGGLLLLLLASLGVQLALGHGARG